MPPAQADRVGDLGDAVGVAVERGDVRALRAEQLRDVARPMPLAAPVTITTRPATLRLLASRHR